MKNGVSLIITILLMSSVQHGFGGIGSVHMNFSSNLYPATPMKNVQSLTMKLWGHVDAAAAHPEIYERFMQDQQHFAQQVLTLHSMLDILLLSLEEQTQECPDCVVQALSDFEYIFEALSVTAQQYTHLTQGVADRFVITVDYLFAMIVSKLEHVLETGQVSTPLYAFFFPPDAHHSRLTTPLLPPANIPPFAPRA